MPGFYGANSLEGAWIDVVIATMVDIEVKLIDIFYGDYDDAKRVIEYNRLRKFFSSKIFKTIKFTVSLILTMHVTILVEYRP